MWHRIQREPALVVGLVQSVLALAITFGVGLTVEQVGAILAATSAVLALVVRSAVVPTVDVVEIDRDELAP